MVCHFHKTINIQYEDFWRISLEDYYRQLVDDVQSHRIRLFLPGSESFSSADSYILYGSYTREQIIDIQQIQNEDGTWEYREIAIPKFRIQRILEKGSGKTQAILNTFFIPYKQYSLRYILFHLHEFFSQPTSQDAYRLTERYENTFKDWLKWLRDHIMVLRDLGLTRNYIDNWKILGQWVEEIFCDLPKWSTISLKRLNLGLFQDHRMPENTMYRNYVPDG